MYILSQCKHVISKQTDIDEKSSGVEMSYIKYWDCLVLHVLSETVWLKEKTNVPIFSKPRAKNTNSTSKNTILFFCWHKSLYRYRVNLLYRTACSYLLFNLTQSIRCVLEHLIKNFLMFSQSQFKNSYMFRSQQTVNTTFQNNIKMQYISIHHI